MCGIVAVLRRPSDRRAPEPGGVIAGLDAVAGLLAGSETPASLRRVTAAILGQAAAQLSQVNQQLLGVPGLTCLLAEPELAVLDRVAVKATRIGALIEEIERGLDAGTLYLGSDEQESVNAAMVALKDAWWAVGRDRVDVARAIWDLAPAGPRTAASLGSAALEGLWAIQVALASLDRLEVRGRDSAGLHILIVGHGLDLDAPDVRALIGIRDADPLFGSLAVRHTAGCLSLVYKAAAEIGELGDNVRALRAAIRNDPLLVRALGQPGA